MSRAAVRVSLASRTSLLLAALVALLAFCWPLLWHPGAGLQGDSQAPLVFSLLLVAVIGLVVVQLSGDELDVKALAMLGVLSAVGAALRPLGAGTAGVELVFFLLLLAGRVFGAGFGFLLGITTLFSSALLTSGVGPWLPYQMMAAGFVGLGAGVLPRARGRLEVVLLAAYGAVSAFVYGSLMDLAFWPFTLGPDAALSFDPARPLATNLHRFLVYELATASAWNAGRAVTNVVTVVLLGPPLLRVLRRAARRAVLD